MSKVENVINEIPVMVCRKCKIFGKDVIWAWRKRCAFCGRLTDKYDVSHILSGKSGKNSGDGIPRFPRRIYSNDEQKQIVNTINEKTRDFDCPGKVMEIKPGPVVTEYRFVPDRYTRLSRLKSLNEDLAVALAAESVTIQRIPSKSAIGITLPNAERKKILFRDCLKNVIAHRNDMELPVNLGVTATGEPWVEDFIDFPHFLVAGSTGAGKSNWINSFLTSLLYIRSPKELRLALIDPKSVELFPYANLPHVIGKPVCQIFDALSLLHTMVEEMKRRTINLQLADVKNIQEYNAKMKAAGKADDKWPYILVVIDEMAQLVIQEKAAFTAILAELSGMARAAGIHVLCATQRPSVDVLSGKIKVNFPTRLAFRVPGKADSITILGHKGAEGLLGKGDMFYRSEKNSELRRLHAPFIQKEDIDKMLRLSIEIGHHLNVPADGLEDALPSAPKKKGQLSLIN